MVHRPPGPGCKWLNAEEKAWLEGEIEADRATVDTAKGTVSLAGLLTSPRVWAASLCWFATLVGAYGVIYWLPLVVKQLSGASDLSVGFLSAIPWIGVGAGMLIGGWLSDRNNERYWHLALPAIGSRASPWPGRRYAGFDWLGLSAPDACRLRLRRGPGRLLGLPTSFLSGAALTAGVALINTIGSSPAALVGPKVFGWLRESTGAFDHAGPVHGRAAGPGRSGGDGDQAATGAGLTPSLGPIDNRTTAAIKQCRPDQFGVRSAGLVCRRTSFNTKVARAAGQYAGRSLQRHAIAVLALVEQDDGADNTDTANSRHRQHHDPASAAVRWSTRRPGRRPSSWAWPPRCSRGRSASQSQDGHRNADQFFLDEIAFDVVLGSPVLPMRVITARRSK